MFTATKCGIKFVWTFRLFATGSAAITRWRRNNKVTWLAHFPVSKRHEHQSNSKINRSKFSHFDLWYCTISHYEQYIRLIRWRNHRQIVWHSSVSLWNISRKSVAESGKTPRTGAQHLVEIHSRHEYASSVLPGACFASTMGVVLFGSHYDFWRLINISVNPFGDYWAVQWVQIEFVNLYFPYAGRGLLVLRWQQQHFELQPARVAVEGRSCVVLNLPHHIARIQITQFQWDFLACCTRSVSVHLMMACVGCSFDTFSVFLLSLKQQQNLMKIMFSCIHFPVWSYPPKIMKKFNFILVNCMGWQVWNHSMHTWKWYCDSVIYKASQTNWSFSQGGQL